MSVRKINVKINRRLAKKGGSLQATLGLETPLTLAIQPGTKNNDCLFKGVLRKKFGSVVCDEYTEIYASVSKFHWWIIPPAIVTVLLVLLCVQDCNEMQSEHQSTSNTITEKQTTGTTEATTEVEMILPRLSSLVTYSENEITEDDHGCYINDVILVSLNPEASEDAQNHALLEILEMTHGELLGGVKNAGLAQIYVTSHSYEELRAICSQVVEIDNVDVATLDFALEEDDADGPDHLGYQWWENAIYANEAWEYLEYVNECKVGVLDSPVDETHEDLNIDEKNKNTEQEYKYSGSREHGTHVSGIIAALHNDIGINGLNPKANLYTFVVGSSLFNKRFESYVIYGIDWLLSKDVRIVNASVGIDDTGEESKDAKLFENAILSWEKNYGDNFIIVQSAGNCGWSPSQGNSLYNGLFAGVTNEAVLDHIVIVANATWEPDKGYRYYSLNGNSQYGQYVTIAAPGTDIYSTIPGNDYKYMDGTSQAAPMVTGVLSLIWGINPDLSAAEAKNILVSSATEIAYENPDHETSGRSTYPFLNALRAVQMAIDSNKELEEIEADPGQNVDIVEVKTYNVLHDFLGESFETVREHYGEPNGGIGIDADGICLSYTIDGNYIIFAEIDEGSGVVNEIQVVFSNNNAPEILIYSGVTSHMSRDEIAKTLKGYTYEDQTTVDALTLTASSQTDCLFCNWNPSEPTRMSFLRMQTVR